MRTSPGDFSQHEMGIITARKPVKGDARCFTGDVAAMLANGDVAGVEKISDRRTERHVEIGDDHSLPGLNRDRFRQVRTKQLTGNRDGKTVRFPDGFDLTLVAADSQRCIRWLIGGK